MKPIVRAFEERDLDAVIALSLRAWAPVFDSIQRVLGESGVYARMHDDWRTDQRRAVRDACATDDMRVWVAEVDSVIAGFVAGRVDHDSSMGEVHMIAVDPDHQRGGVGTLLTTTATRWFTESGMTLAMVETGGDEGHAPARRVYEQAGFTPLPIARYFKAL